MPPLKILKYLGHGKIVMTQIAKNPTNYKAMNTIHF
jgi:hypothetical protein